MRGMPPWSCDGHLPAIVSHKGSVVEQRTGVLFPYLRRDPGYFESTQHRAQSCVYQDAACIPILSSQQSDAEKELFIV